MLREDREKEQQGGRNRRVGRGEFKHLENMRNDLSFTVLCEFITGTFHLRDTRHYFRTIEHIQPGGRDKRVRGGDVNYLENILTDLSYRSVNLLPVVSTSEAHDTAFDY